MELYKEIKKIVPADRTAYDACRRRWDRIAKPLGSLGKMEELLACIAGITGDPDIYIAKKGVLVFCADNGVLAQGVAQSGHEVTTSIARSLLAGTTAVCAMAKAAQADVFPIDVGMVDTLPGLPRDKTACGTADMTLGPAMTRAQCLHAIKAGMQSVEDKKGEGYRLLAVGEAGIGNTTTSAAVASVLLGLPVEVVTGRGSGLSDEGLIRKQKAIEKAIAVNRPDPADPLDVLAKVGGFDIAAMTGAFLGGALHHIPMVVDGLISSVAALCAVRLCPNARDYLLPSHRTAEPAGKAILEELRLDPMIDGGLRLGEGTGAAVLFPLLDMAAAVYHHAATFEDIEVEAYKPL